MYAVIVENEIVINVIVVDDINFMPGLVEIPEGKFIHIGDNINDMFDVVKPVEATTIPKTSSSTDGTPTIV